MNQVFHKQKLKPRHIDEKHVSVW